MLLEWHRRLKIIQQFIISEYNKRLVLKTVKNLNHSKLLPNALHGCILFLIVLETTAKGDPGAESSSTLAPCMAWLDCRKELEWVLLFHSQKLSEEPLLRASPEELDSDLLVNTQWKLLTDFILQKDAEHRSHQQLVNIKIHKGWLTDIMFYCCSTWLFWCSAFFIKGRSMFRWKWSCVNISSAGRHTQQPDSKPCRHQWVNRAVSHWNSLLYIQYLLQVWAL